MEGKSGRPVSQCSKDWAAADKPTRSADIHTGGGRQGQLSFFSFSFLFFLFTF